MDETYESFLRSLDNSQLLGHIQGLSQNGDPKTWSFHETSTPNQPEKARKTISIRSTESDPFDDGLDTVLLELDGNEQDEPKAVTENHPQEASSQEDALVALRSDSNGWVPGNQLMEVGVNEIPEAKNPLQEEEDESTEEETTMFADVGPLHEFGDYGTYFQNKHLKQQKADEAYIEWERKRRAASGDKIEGADIFKGCVIFVNGNTNPSLGVIHKLVILHGGIFLNYLTSKGAATHIICDRFTPRKRIQFRNYKVVRATWIADCVKEKKLLNWRDYRLIDDIDYDQKRLGFDVVQNEEADREHLEEIQEAEIEEGNEILEENEFQEAENEFQEAENEFQEAGLSEEFEHQDEEAALEQAELDNMDVGPSAEPVEEDVSGSLHVGLNVAQERTHTSVMDAKHPNFLEHFFANSRLHHLSAWKADLRAKFLRMVAKNALADKASAAAKIQKAKINPTPEDSIVLHIDFDCFFATASALAHPELDMEKDPIAVSHGGKSSDIASCNYVARKRGVTNGMWLGKAQQYCPELKVIDYDFNAYEKYSNSFYDYLLSKKVFDSIFPVSIDEALVDATSHCRNQSPEFIADFCRQIRSDIFRLTNCSVSIGASKNVLLAKLATKKAKPNNFFYLHENIQNYLDECKLKDLPNVGWSISEKVTNELKLDVNPKELLIKEARNLTQQRLVTILGEKIGARVYEMCRGIDRTSIVLDLSSSEAMLGRKTVSVDVNFGIRFDKFDQAELFLMKIAKELHKRLVALKVCGSVITLKLARRAPNAPKNPPKFMGLGICDYFSRSSRMGVPTNDWGILGSEMKALFRIMNIPVEDLRGIAVSIAKLEDIEAVKKQRQKRLEFNNPRPKPVKQPLQSSQLNPFADTVVNSDSIDWKVFNMLPPDIRQELKKELLRRGIPVSGKETSPVKKSSWDGESGKVYLQQLFPTQANGPFKVARVIESPKKKRRLGVSPKKKSVSPIKEPKSPTPYNDTISYDEDVLNEIPTLIREEFFKDLAWQKNHKRLKPISIRARLEQKKESLKAIEDSEITREWLNSRPRAVVIEGLTGGYFDLEDTIDQAREWVRSSVQHRGPHPDDVAMFYQFLIRVASQGNIGICVGILRNIRDEIDLQDTMLKLCDSKDVETYRSGIADWRKQFMVNLEGALKTYLLQRNIELRL